MEVKELYTILRAINKCLDRSGQSNSHQILIDDLAKQLCISVERVHEILLDLVHRFDAFSGRDRFYVNGPKLDLLIGNMEEKNRIETENKNIEKGQYMISNKTYFIAIIALLISIGGMLNSLYGTFAGNNTDDYKSLQRQIDSLRCEVEKLMSNGQGTGIKDMNAVDESKDIECSK